MEREGRQGGRFWPWFWSVWALALGGLVWRLHSLADYIWAPIPADYPPGQLPEGQGEGMAFVFLFLPGLLIVLVLLLAPFVVMRVRRANRNRTPTGG